MCIIAIIAIIGIIVITGNIVVILIVTIVMIVNGIVMQTCSFRLLWMHTADVHICSYA